jgi:integrase
MFEDMGKKEEWLTSFLRESTRKHNERSLRYFEEFSGLNPDQMIETRRAEGRRFSTRVVEFWRWCQTYKKCTPSSASSVTFGLASFFKYFELPLQLKRVIPNTSMKIEDYAPNLEDLQKVFRLGDLQTKVLLSLMRDSPCRVGDLVKKVIPQLPKKEFMIESEKENVVGKVYFADSTIELFNQMAKTGLSLPTTERGIAKMLEKACKVADLPPLNPHLLRKFFFSIGVNLNINEITLKVLMFKSVPKDVLTYVLNKENLKTSWQMIVNAIPLEKTSGNGAERLDQLKDSMLSLEKENTNFKTRIDNLQNHMMKLEDKVELYGKTLQSYVELGPYTEEEKEALRKKLDLQPYTQEEWTVIEQGLTLMMKECPKDQKAIVDKLLSRRKKRR